MPRGGARPGAGSKPRWKSGKTKTIRIPEALEKKLMKIARALDEGKKISVVESDSLSTRVLKNEIVTESKKVIDLTGVVIRSLNNQPVVYLSDLVRLGYELKPVEIMRSVGLTRALRKQERTSGLQKTVREEIESVNRQMSLFEDV